MSVYTKARAAGPNRVDIIREYARLDWSPDVAERVASDLIDVATGNRDGNPFERRILSELFDDYRADDETMVRLGID